MTESTLETSLEDLTTLDSQAHHGEVIATVIDSLARDGSAMVNHGETGSLWKFDYGSVTVLVQLTGETEEDLLTVWAPVLALPARDEVGLMRRILAMNWSDTLEASFALMNGQVVVKAQRTVADLSPGELSRAITLVASIADDYDDLLKEEFGGV